MKKLNELIALRFENEDHFYYIKGHLSIVDAQSVLDAEYDDLKVKSVSHKYGRCIKIGLNHYDCFDDNETTFRVLESPRKSYYAVTEVLSEKSQD